MQYFIFFKTLQRVVTSYLYVAIPSIFEHICAMSLHIFHSSKGIVCKESSTTLIFIILLPMDRRTIWHIILGNICNEVAVLAKHPSKRFLG